ncbi:hypothetical protein TRFO_42615 [Tritrichomonas foetus]|uniref:DBF4-type domain-containing protein n=1 Tax=Tritrichomonas foetus TaxID=1144522 RepID=A0A1J4KVK3_9EUKA|nr:hypothetical protein TRFO_42615 [Tritrichomonas foetus]|eukprot:OHT15271.1 hypothetical protein TRFO_42615 [Tritrichomonas foetus]
MKIYLSIKEKVPEKSFRLQLFQLKNSKDFMAETSNSAPFISYDYEEKKGTKVSLDVKNVGSPGLVINPLLFNDLSIFISLSNITMTEIIQYSLLQKCSPKLVISPYFADIVISDKPIVLPPIPSSRGKKTLKNSSRNNFKTKQPRVILLDQIPWIYDPIIETKARTAMQLREIPEKKVDSIVVSDIRHQYRPNVKKLQFPELFFPPKKLKGYTLSPFNPVPHNFGKQQQNASNANNNNIQSSLIFPTNASNNACNQTSVGNQKNVNINTYHENGAQTPKIEVEAPKKAPPEKRYCDICQICFDDPEEHHESLTHKRNSDVFRWLEFDQLANSINLL